MPRAASLFVALLPFVMAAGCTRKPAESQPGEPSAVSARRTPPPPHAGEPLGEVPPAPPLPAEAEVEMVGKVDPGPLQNVDQYILYAQPQPCEARPRQVKPWGSVRIPGIGALTFMLEVFVPQGTKGHLCAVALDAKGRVVGTAANPTNPIHMEGAGEVMVTDLRLTVTATPPAALPAGL